MAHRTRNAISTTIGVSNQMNLNSQMSASVALLLLGTRTARYRCTGKEH